MGDSAYERYRHRLNAVVDADQIFVVHEGEIVERGTHGELMGMGGKYKALWDKYEKKGTPGGKGAESPEIPVGDKGKTGGEGGAGGADTVGVLD